MRHPKLNEFTWLIALVLSMDASSTFCTPLSTIDVTFTTSQAEFDAGIRNQGWWAIPNDRFPDPAADNFNGNDNYFVGSNTSIVHRDFFTFNLDSPILDRVKIEGATLRLSVGGSNFSQIEFFDVSTDAAVLNRNDGTNLQIFDDLGSGDSYGLFNVDNSQRRPSLDVLEFDLADAALKDIKKARGGYFSIGGMLPGVTDTDSIFGFSGTASIDLPAGVQELVLHVRPLDEPGTNALLLAALAAMAWFLARRFACPRLTSGSRS